MEQKSPVLKSITETLTENYMPYAMSVIISRALPEIDGFKPSHRKLLYTMYRMGLLTGARTKSANVVGQTMRLNPHGDQAIYETLVRLSRGYEALLCPFIDSKGNFGKVYSRDMAYAASRYTEVKLAPICSELFSGIDCDSVDFADNYDSTMKEPQLLPSAFPNILASSNTGIAVSMASSICSFNLAEVCQTAMDYLKNPEHDLLSTLKAPDFPTGGELIYNRPDMESIYKTGRGSFKVRARYRYDKKHNLIEILEIPYTTTVEAVMDKAAELVKAGKLREVSDMRDESDRSGLKLTVDLKRGTDPDKLMQKLYKMTPLMDSFSCNFNILIAGMPRVMGIREILEEWTAWRVESKKRTLHFDLNRKKEKLHLLVGLRKIILDIDRAIRIIRETGEDAEVIPNLMIGFGIDKLQAEFVAEIRLRNINREHLAQRLSETDDLEKEIAELQDTLKSREKIKALIIAELSRIMLRYGAPRRTGIVYEHDVETYDEAANIEDYPVNIFLTREGYFKKITPLSYRMGSEHKLKDGDSIFSEFETTNRCEVVFLTSLCRAYKAKLFEFDDQKASVLGDYLPSKFEMEEGESVVYMFLPGPAYAGSMVFVFENGKVARVELKSFDTVSNRRRLTGAYSDKSPLVCAFCLFEDTELALFSSAGRVLIINTAALAPKSSRGTQGVAVMTLKKNQKVVKASLFSESGLPNPSRYRVRTLPAAGALLRLTDEKTDQLTLD